LDRGLVVGSAVLGMFACKHDTTNQTETTGATTTTGASAIADPNDATIDRITEAQCKREVRCDTPGKNNEKWSDEAACRRELRPNYYTDFRARACRVVLTDRLQSCIEAINTDKCNDVYDISRVTACRRTNICVE
jgi:hypothetical protein